MLHCDCNSFFASVETVFHPEYASVPMAVCGSSEDRHGIVLAKNELAKRAGVKTGEVIWQAKRKCPSLVTADPHYREYERYSRTLNEIYYEYTDLIEPFGIDESWLDVTAVRGILGDGKTIADDIRARVRRELGITVSVGVSFNKVFSKLGSDYRKPDATTVISRDNFRDMVYPLPASDLLFVGPRSSQSLARIGIYTIGDIAAAGRRALTDALGKNGSVIYDYACGFECSAVEPAGTSRDVKSIGNGLTFRRDLCCDDDIRAGVWALSDTVAARMRSSGVLCGTIAVTVKDPLLRSSSRQKRLDEPTDLACDIADAALSMIPYLVASGAPVRAITITGQDIMPEKKYPLQQVMFPDRRAVRREKARRIERAVDSIRDRFGGDSVMRASSVRSDIGI